MIDCDELIERKGLRKVVNRKREVKREKTRKEKQGVKTFHSLRVTSPTNARTTAALECEHLSHHVWPLNCYFQQYKPAILRVRDYD